PLAVQVHDEDRREGDERGQEPDIVTHLHVVGDLEEPRDRAVEDRDQSNGQACEEKAVAAARDAHHHHVSSSPVNTARGTQVVLQAADALARAQGRAPLPSVRAEFLHLFGEVEVVFGLWAVVLVVAITIARGWEVAAHYLNDTVIFTEALFVVVIMALAST